MNQACVMTVCTADHFQHYLPLFIRCIRRWGDGVDIRVYVRGRLDVLTRNCIDCLTDYGIMKGYDFITEDYRTDLPFAQSTTNCIRFSMCEPELMEYALVLITDIDLLLFNDPFSWHVQMMAETRQPFAGHHGPWRKPYRPEVSKEGWVGAFERTAGGFFCVEPGKWYPATAEQRKYQEEDMKYGAIGKWRESDEVMLSKIIKGSGFKMPMPGGFPLELRGVHLGDFKPSMKHRYTNMAKMQRKLSDENAQKYILFQRDIAWQNIVTVLRHDAALAEVLDNLAWHIEQRGLV